MLITCISNSIIFHLILVKNHWMSWSQSQVSYKRTTSNFLAFVHMVRCSGKMVNVTHMVSMVSMAHVGAKLTVLMD